MSLKFRTPSDLIFRSLPFSEKFTTLCKGIANTSDISTTVSKLGFKTLLIAITLLNSSALPIPPKITVDTVVIDPGHGGKDPGTHGASVNEKDVVLKISLKVGSYIERNYPGVKVIYTRKDDRYMPLDERAMLANKHKADVFICIHANASPNATAYGTETYVMGMHKTESNLEVAKRENAVMLYDENHEERYEGFDPKSPESYILFSLAQSAYQESSLVLAHKIETQFKSKTCLLYTSDAADE